MKTNYSKRVILAGATLFLATVGAAQAQSPAQSPEDLQKTLSHFRFQRQGDLSYVVPDQAHDDLPILDGTEKSFTPNELAALFNDNKRPDVEMYLLLQQVRDKNSRDARTFLRSRIEQIAPIGRLCPATELLMCFILHRSLEISDIIDSFTDHRQPGILDQEVRVMTEAVRMAGDYYTSVYAFIHDTSVSKDRIFKPPYRKFGQEFADKFLKISDSVLMAQAQYNVVFTILGYLQYDLMRAPDSDLNAEAARVLYLTLNDLPKPDQPDPSTPSQRIQNIRLLWRGYLQATEVLAKFSPGSPGRVGSASSGSANSEVAQYPAHSRVYLADGYQERWVQRTDSASGAVYVSAKKDSTETREWIPVQPRDLLRVIDANGEFRENDEVSDETLSSTGKIEAVLESGLLVVAWKNGPARPRATTSAFLYKGTQTMGAYSVRQSKVWIDSKRAAGLIVALYVSADEGSGLAVVTLESGEEWRGSLKEIRIF